MSNTTENSKRIAKNTLFLYVRMLLIMVVTLYTSRVVLNVLGVEDFGIYNVVGGLVSMFAFFSSSLSNATQRFLNFELGKGNLEKVQNVFNLSVLIYLIISSVVFIFAEVVGLWLIYNKLVIPPERLEAALWIFHATLISLFFTLNGIVFNSVLIARENMKAYAYIGLIEAFLRLLIALALSYFAYDKLKLYAILLLCVTICIQGCYAIICIKKYPECRYRFFWQSGLFKEMFKFAGWNVFGTAIWSINEQGTNIMLNIFFGPVINAAKGVASQVNSAVNNFSMNFFTAVRPQIVKSYASGDIDYFIKLIYNSSRYSFYLMLLITLPILFRSDYILYLWLKQIPDFAPAFVRWILIYSLINVLTNPFWFAIQAVGKLKKYCLIGGLVYLTAFPISYIFLSLGYSPVSVFIILAAVRAVYLFVTIKITNNYVNFSMAEYIYSVLIPIAKVTIVSVLIIGLINLFLPQNFFALVVICLFCFIITPLTIYSIGVTGQERLYIKNKITELLKWRKK